MKVKRSYFSSSYGNNFEIKYFGNEYRFLRFLKTVVREYKLLQSAISIALYVKKQRLHCSLNLYLLIAKVSNRGGFERTLKRV